MARPANIINLVDYLDDFYAEMLDDYLTFLEAKEERLTAIEDYLNRAEDQGITAVVDYFKDFKTI